MFRFGIMIAQEERSLAPLTTCWRSIELIAKKPYGPFKWKQNDFMDNFMFNQDKDSNGLKGSLFNGCDRSTWIHALLFHRITLPPSHPSALFCSWTEQECTRVPDGRLALVYIPPAPFQPTVSSETLSRQHVQGRPPPPAGITIKNAQTMASHQWGLN